MIDVNPHDDLNDKNKYQLLFFITNRLLSLGIITLCILLSFYYSIIILLSFCYHSIIILLSFYSHFTVR